MSRLNSFFALPKLAGLLSLLILAALLAACAQPAPATSSPRVTFVEPRDSATVSSPVTVKMAAENFTVEPAGEVKAGAGHLHIIVVDGDCVAAGQVIAKDETHLHYGQGQLETTLELAAGPHTLCLQAAGGVHTALSGSGMTQKININVQTLAESGIPAVAGADLVVAANLLVVLVHFALALLIFGRRHYDWVAWLVAVTLVANGALAPLAFLYGNLAAPAGSQFAVALVIYLGLISSIATVYLFPDGRWALGWSRWLLLVWATLSLPAMFAPASALSFSQWPLLLKLLLLAGWVGTGLFAQLQRYQHAADSIQRQQIKWGGLGLLAAAMTPVVYFAPFVILPAIDVSGLPNLLVNRLGPALFAVPALVEVLGLTALRLALLLVPLSLAIAILRYRLWDIDLVINRTLVYGGLTALVLLLYGLIVGGLALLFQAQAGPGMAMAATAVVALLAMPLRQRLQRSVNRLMYGDRDDPIAALTRLGLSLEAASAPADVLPNLTRTVAESLRLPRVAIALREGEGFRVVAESSPSPPAPLPLRERGEVPAPSKEDGGALIPLTYQGEIVGQLIVAPRGPGEAFSPADRRLLADLARQAGPAAHAVQLTADLQRSRLRLVTTREEERRRLRRDLHDGLGPQLASISLKVDAARNFLASNPLEADRLLADFKTQIQDAIADVRRLVYGLRPPALDQLGLAGALREHANSINAGYALRVDVEAPQALPTLPAAVEVAAYRIINEALTNVVRHSQARRCTVWLCLDDALYLAIDDDGNGLPEGYRPGVGLTSMRERAEELGGTWRIERRQEGGMRVSARLPLSGLATSDMLISVL